MARMACLSVRQFTNQFKAVHGVTFMQYLHYHRVSFAQKLLAETDQDISAICFESGFNDLAHFYRIFKRLSGCSPRKYRLNAHKEALKNAQPENEKSLNCGRSLDIHSTIFYIARPNLQQLSA